MAGLFITGTDTGVGKTQVTLAFMRLLQQRGYRVIGMKPVATGCVWVNGELRNEDALQFQAQSSVQLRYVEINPYAFEPAISPHIAAELAGREISLQCLVGQCRSLQAKADCVLVEGVGGWLVPLSKREKLADLAHELALPVVLVVGMRLGCLNHALLTFRSLIDSQVSLAGWVANLCEPGFEYLEENISTLKHCLSLPYLGSLPYSESGGNLTGLNGLDADEILRRADV